MAVDLFQYLQEGEVHLIEFSLPESLDIAEFDRLNEMTLALVRGNKQKPWVIDLHLVDYIGSAVMGLIINIRQQVKAGGGRLVVCGLSANLQEIFRTTSLERLFTVVQNRGEAIRILVSP